MVEIISDLWICRDCLFVLANGDYPDDEGRAAAIVAGEVRELPAHWALNGTADGEADGADEQEFSRQSCDCCRSREAGPRHRAALITNVSEGT
jgi:hypothetical protein